MALRAARILSSETDNTIAQTQTTNVNIKVDHQSKPKPATNINPSPSGTIYYPNVPANFTMPTQMDASQYQSVQPTVNEQVEPDLQHLKHKLMMSQQETSDLAQECAELEKRNKFLELLLTAYEQNPIKINSVIICNNRLLIEMIKLLTEADKVDLILNDDISCDCSGCGCSPDHDELLYITRILITKNGKTEDLKYAYNSVHSEFVKFGVSLKITTQ